MKIIKFSVAIICFSILLSGILTNAKRHTSKNQHKTHKHRNNHLKKGPNDVANPTQTAVQSNTQTQVPVQGTTQPQVAPVPVLAPAQGVAPQNVPNPAPAPAPVGTFQNGVAPQPQPQSVNTFSLPDSCDADPESLSDIFHDKSLENNKDREDLLTKKSLNIVFCAFGYTQTQITQCMQKTLPENRMLVMAIIMKKGEFNNLTEAENNSLKAALAGCQGLETLSGQLSTRWVNIIPILKRFKKQPGLRPFFKRLRRFRRLKLRRMK
jgi:hypothetical protein